MQTAALRLDLIRDHVGTLGQSGGFLKGRGSGFPRFEQSDIVCLDQSNNKSISYKCTWMLPQRDP